MSLHESIHKDDLRLYNNRQLAKMYSVSEREVARARTLTGIKRELYPVEIAEIDYYSMSRLKVAEKYNVSENYVRRYAQTKHWRKG